MTALHANIYPPSAYNISIASVLTRNLNMYFVRYECDTCERLFDSEDGAIQHMSARDHWGPRYERATLAFSSQWLTNQHTDSTGRRMPQFECETCNRKFYSQASANQHMNDTSHWAPRFECDICDRSFQSQHSVDQHMDATNHYKGRYCYDCKRGFQNENNLKMVGSYCTR